MIKKVILVAPLIALCLSVCVATTSCTKKDKYYYMHEQIDQIKAYNEAKEAGDSEKMTAIHKEMEITSENIKNCEEIEQAAKEKGELKKK